MNEPLIAFFAVLCNVTAQLSMKYSSHETLANKWSYLTSPWLLLAVALYGLSFLLTIRVFAVNPLSVASPTMAGATFFLIATRSAILFGESFGLQKAAGILLIFVGIFFLTRPQ